MVRKVTSGFVFVNKIRCVCRISMIFCVHVSEVMGLQCGKFGVCSQYGCKVVVLKSSNLIVYVRYSDDWSVYTPMIVGQAF